MWHVSFHAEKQAPQTFTSLLLGANPSSSQSLLGDKGYSSKTTDGIGSQFLYDTPVGKESIERKRG